MEESLVMECSHGMGKVMVETADQVIEKKETKMNGRR